MFNCSTFISPCLATSSKETGSKQSLKAVLLTGPLLGLLLGFFLSGCKSASTPTQAQMPAQPQSQTSQQQPRSQAPQAPQAPQAQPDFDPAQRSTNAGSTHSARSDEEIIADIDTELDASIADFDGMILDERAKAEAIEASLGGSDAGANSGVLGGDSGGDGSLFEDGDIYEGLPGYGDFPESVDQADNNSDGQEASYEGGDSTPSGDASHSESATESSTASAGGPETTRRGGIPEDIAGGSDDDIVARQIREAALKEKDPALQEKLWDEYRKYKNQQ